MPRDDFEDDDYEMEFDEDFLDDEPKQKSSGVISDFLTGLKESLLGDVKETVKDVVSSVIPYHVRDEIDSYSELFTAAQEEIESSLLDFRSNASKSLKQLDGLLPEKLDTVINDIQKKIKVEASDDYNTGSVNRQPTDTIAEDIANALSNTMSTTTAISENAENNRFRFTSGLMQSSTKELTKLYHFQTTVAYSYYKKSLELQYQSLYLSRNQYTLLEKSMGSVLDKLNLIAVSSVMTDKDKTELQMKKELISVRKNIFNTSVNLDKFRKNIKDTLKNNIGEYSNKLDSFTSGLSSFLPMIMNGQGGAAGMVGSVAGDMLKNYAGEKIYSYLENSKISKDTVNKIKLAGGDIPGFLSRYGRKNDTILGKGASFLSDMIGKNNVDSTVIRKEDITAPAIYDNKTRTTIIDVIPELLSKIYTTLERSSRGDNGISGGNTGSRKLDTEYGDDIRYDYEAGKFLTRDKIKNKASKQLGKELFNEPSKYVDAVIDILVSYGDLDMSDTDGELLRSSILIYASSAKEFLPEDLGTSVITKNLSSELASKVVTAGKKLLAKTKDDPALLDRIFLVIRKLRDSFTQPTAALKRALDSGTGILDGFKSLNKPEMRDGSGNFKKNLTGTDVGELYGEILGKGPLSSITPIKPYAKENALKTGPLVDNANIDIKPDYSNMTYRERIEATYNNVRKATTDVGREIDEALPAGLKDSEYVKKAANVVRDVKNTASSIGGKINDKYNELELSDNVNDKLTKVKNSSVIEKARELTNHVLDSKNVKEALNIPDMKKISNFVSNVKEIYSKESKITKEEAAEKVLLLANKIGLSVLSDDELKSLALEYRKSKSVLSLDLYLLSKGKIRNKESITKKVLSGFDKYESLKQVFKKTYDDAVSKFVAAKSKLENNSKISKVVDFFTKKKEVADNQPVDELPKFAKGGYTGRKTKKRRFTDKTGEDIAGVTHKDEFVINSTDLKRPDVAAVLNSLNLTSGKIPTDNHNLLIKGTRFIDKKAAGATMTGLGLLGKIGAKTLGKVGKKAALAVPNLVADSAKSMGLGLFDKTIGRSDKMMSALGLTREGVEKRADGLVGGLMNSFTESLEEHRRKSEHGLIIKSTRAIDKMLAGALLGVAKFAVKSSFNLGKMAITGAMKTAWWGLKKVPGIGILARGAESITKGLGNKYDAVKESVSNKFTAFKDRVKKKFTKKDKESDVDGKDGFFSSIINSISGKKTSTTDRDGDGKRDGSWEESTGKKDGLRKSFFNKVKDKVAGVTGGNSIFDMLKKFLPFVTVILGKVWTSITGLPSALSGLLGKLGGVGTKIAEFGGKVVSGAVDAGRVVLSGAGKLASKITPAKVKAAFALLKKRIGVKFVEKEAAEVVEKKLATKIASRLIPVIGEASLIYDIGSISKLMYDGHSFLSSVSLYYLDTDLFADDGHITQTRSVDNATTNKPQQIKKTEDTKPTQNTKPNTNNNQTSNPNDDPGDRFKNNGVLGMLQNGAERTFNFLTGEGFQTNSSIANAGKTKAYASKSSVLETIAQGAGRAGIPEYGNDLKVMAAIESSLNPNANVNAGPHKAKGLFQFLDSTWNSTVRSRDGLAAGLNATSSVADPMASAIAGAIYTKNNINLFKRNGINPTMTHIYAAHFLGPGTALNLFRASPDTLISSIHGIGPKQIKDNPEMLNPKGPSTTVGDVLAKINQRIAEEATPLGVRVPVAGPTTPGSANQFLQKQNPVQPANRTNPTNTASNTTILGDNKKTPDDPVSKIPNAEQPFNEATRVKASNRTTIDRTAASASLSSQTNTNYSVSKDVITPQTDIMVSVLRESLSVHKANLEVSRAILKAIGGITPAQNNTDTAKKENNSPSDLPKIKNTLPTPAISLTRRQFM